MSSLLLLLFTSRCIDYKVEGLDHVGPSIETFRKREPSYITPNIILRHKEGQDDEFTHWEHQRRSRDEVLGPPQSLHPVSLSPLSKVRRKETSRLRNTNYSEPSCRWDTTSKKGMSSIPLRSRHGRLRVQRQLVERRSEQV